MDSAQPIKIPMADSIKVLIADDDTPTRILLKAAISQWGYQTIEAKDGEEAWALIQQVDSPKILILDWLMPKLDGVALCQRIRKELTIQPFIILLTQMTGSTNTVKGLDAGADEFLPKPFNMAELHSRLMIGSRIILTEYKNNQYKKMIHDINEKLTMLDELTGAQIKNTIHEIQELIKTTEKK